MPRLGCAPSSPARTSNRNLLVFSACDDACRGVPAAVAAAPSTVRLLASAGRAMRRADPASDMHVGIMLPLFSGQTVSAWALGLAQSVTVPRRFGLCAVKLGEYRHATSVNGASASVLMTCVQHSRPKLRLHTRLACSQRAADQPAR